MKIAVFHSFLKNRGGAEKVVIDLSRYYKADFWVGGVRSDLFNVNSNDSFSKAVFHELVSFHSLHEDSKIPLWRHVKRQLFFLFSPQVNELRDYDIVFISGNVFWVPGRIKRNNPKTKIITYCHTPPRLFTDQFGKINSQLPSLLRPFYTLFKNIVLHIYSRGLKQSDVLIANSQNIKARIAKYLDLDSIPIYPPIVTDRFRFVSDGNFYLSHARLEDMKRIKLIVEAFARRPDLHLVMCSTGPLKEWVMNEIKARSLTNIDFRGLVSDDELSELVGTCRAGICIPIDEDAGITQCELMAAGKPVLGVAEGGLLETVIHKKTGFLINANPTVDDLIVGLNWLEDANINSMQQDCINQARLFDESVFYNKMDSTIERIFDNES